MLSRTRDATSGLKLHKRKFFVVLNRIADPDPAYFLIPDPDPVLDTGF
jgi:hypothetical protein